MGPVLIIFLMNVNPPNDRKSIRPSSFTSELLFKFTPLRFGEHAGRAVKIRFFRIPRRKTKAGPNVKMGRYPPLWPSNRYVQQVIWVSEFWPFFGGEFLVKINQAFVISPFLSSMKNSSVSWIIGFCHSLFHYHTALIRVFRWQNGVLVGPSLRQNIWWVAL